MDKCFWLVSALLAGFRFAFRGSCVACTFAMRGELSQASSWIGMCLGSFLRLEVSRLLQPEEHWILEEYGSTGQRCSSWGRGHVTL